MKVVWGIVVGLGLTLGALAGCGAANATTPTSGAPHGDIVEVIIPLTDGREVVCLEDTVTRGVGLSCDWVGAK